MNPKIFKQQKQRQLSKSDKSSIGGWDPKIKPLCNKINKNSKYYTTSSCAGRIILAKEELKKQPNIFLFRTHKKTTLKEIKSAFKDIQTKKKYNKLVEFKQSPCILHVACLNLESAQELVNKAKLAGWKHSGIMSTKKRFMVELHSTEHLDFPIMNKNKVLVSDEFLELAINQSNLRIERVWKKINKLKNTI